MLPMAAYTMYAKTSGLLQSCCSGWTVASSIILVHQAGSTSSSWLSNSNRWL
jgi:hypothetical protein